MQRSKIHVVSPFNAPQLYTIRELLKQYGKEDTRRILNGEIPVVSAQKVTIH
jgi:hypothetical protein